MNTATCIGCKVHGIVRADSLQIEGDRNWMAVSAQHELGVCNNCSHEQARWYFGQRLTQERGLPLADAMELARKGGAA